MILYFASKVVSENGFCVIKVQQHQNNRVHCAFFGGLLFILKILNLIHVQTKLPEIQFESDQVLSNEHQCLVEFAHVVEKLDLTSNSKSQRKQEKLF